MLKNPSPPTGNRRFRHVICMLTLHTNSLIQIFRTIINQHLQERRNLKAPSATRKFKFWRSKRALALPLTFMILFVSTLGLIAVTYYFSVERVNAQSQNLKVSNAKQDMLALEQTVLAVVWQPGSARTLAVHDCGGRLNVEPSNGSLQVSVSDGHDIAATVYSQTTGQVRYELPYAESPDTGLYLRGDSRTVVNQSGALMSQLYVQSGDEYAELLLRYRPTVSCVATGSEDGKSVNVLRVYVVNLNSSDVFALYGQIPLKISCQSTQISAASFDVAYSLDRLTVTSVMDGVSGSVVVPVSSTAEGAVVNVEVVECNISIERCVM